MLVKDRMTRDPITIAPDASVHDAFRIVQDRGIHYLPVVDKRGRLIGIVTRTDLMRASPSAATTLTVHEANYLLAHLQVKDAMTSPAITVFEEAPLEEAALIMVEKEISCLPVMRAEGRHGQGKLVGIITESDIFRAFVEILGGGDPVLRVTLRAPDVPGELARLTALIARLGGNLHSVAAWRRDDPGYVYFTFRLAGVDEEALVSALDKLGEQVLYACCTG
jgi:acetoin utilization protein AcuB